MNNRIVIPSKENAVLKKNAKPGKKNLTIMVSSCVYGEEGILDQVAVILRQKFGYKVVMSKEGSVYVPAGYTPEQACLEAVKNCDLFFGIIFPRYGSGITHKEFLEAIRLDKSRWFAAHESIEFVRKLLEPKMYTKDKKRKKFDIPKTSVLDSIKVVDMYNAVRSSWVQPFENPGDLYFFIESQFKDKHKRIKEIEEKNIKKK